MCEYKGVNGKNLTIVDENGVVEFKIKKEFVQIDQKTLDEIIRQMNRIKVTNEPFYAQVYGEWVKRKPLPDGTLPMTESEKVEIAKMIGFSMVYRIVCASDHLCAYISPYHKPITVDNIKAILWLADRFELVEN